jgi:putative ABC transport system ATP-binding protein
MTNPDSNETVFDIRNLVKSYYSASETTTPIRGLNLKVSSGEFVLIYGPSGTGKTTLLNLIAGLDIPDSGEIHFMGERYDNKKDHEKTLIRRLQLGVIFQGFELIRSMSCYDNIEYPLLLQDIPEKERKRRIEEVASELGVEAILHRKPDLISGGQQQRIAVARALVPDYNCILGDEITGNLDKKTSRIVYDILTDHKKRQGKSFVLVSHDPELRDYADTVYDLNEGVLV